MGRQHGWPSTRNDQPFLLVAQNPATAIHLPADRCHEWSRVSRLYTTSPAAGSSSRARFYRLHESQSEPYRHTTPRVIALPTVLRMLKPDGCCFGRSTCRCINAADRTFEYPPSAPARQTTTRRQGDAGYHAVMLGLRAANPRSQATCRHPAQRRDARHTPAAEHPS